MAIGVSSGFRRVRLRQGHCTGKPLREVRHVKLITSRCVLFRHPEVLVAQRRASKGDGPGASAVSFEAPLRGAPQDDGSGIAP